MITISRDQKEEIVSHAREAAPAEACGILAGVSNEVRKVYRMSNTSDKPELCYFMDPKEQFKVMKEIRNSELELTAIYHSHPASEAYPSARDLELAFYPEASYIIVSLKEGKADLRSFKVDGGKISEEEII